MRTERLIICILTTVILSGCASRPVNEPIEQVNPEAGYRPYLLLPERQNNDPDTLFILSFSGGGTRAAAFSYGVLEELHRTKVLVNGQQRRLVDEVDIIAGVSGGSFTALAYALHGNRLFSEYEERFLKRDVQGALIGRTLNPFNWWKFVGGSAGRSELAAEYYDEILFEGATFGDLIDKQTPVAVATGTDISTGARLSFFQNDFDLICSDLNTVRLSRAAAASSAVPIVLSPITFNNYGGTCDFQYPAWVQDVEDPDNRSRPLGRALLRYRDMQDFQNSEERPFIHLVDGGVSDNIGVRGILETIQKLSASADYRGEVGFGIIERIVLIVVNSHSSPSTDWDRRETPPGFSAQLLQSSGVPIARYSYETIETLKDIAEIRRLRRELQVAGMRLAGLSEAKADASVPEVTLDVIDVSFDAISDPEERAYFMELPTSFVLPDEDIDRLVGVAGQLMRQSELYVSTVNTMGGSLDQ